MLREVQGTIPTGVWEIESYLAYAGINPDHVLHLWEERSCCPGSFVPSMARSDIEVHA